MTEDKRIEEILKDSFQQDFINEGELVVINFKINSTKNKILEDIPQNDEERKYLEENYDKIIESFIEEFKSKNKIFNNKENKLKREWVTLKIKNSYSEYMRIYNKNKGKYGEFESEFERWKENIEDITKEASEEFSLESLEKILNMIKKNNARVSLIKKIFEKVEEYSRVVQTKTNEIKNCKVEKKEEEELASKIDSFIDFLLNIRSKMENNNSKLMELLNSIEKQGNEIVKDVDRIINNQPENDDETLQEEMDDVIMTATRFAIIKDLFGDKK